MPRYRGKYKEIVERVDSLMAELGIDNLELFCATSFQWKKTVDNIKEEWELFYKTTGGLEPHDIHIRDFIMKVTGWKDE